MPRPFFLTTPIYYVNDVPHIGHAYTTVTADAVARWHRLQGDDVFFLTGTDEHGLKIARAAEANGISPQEHADRTSARYRETWDLLDIAPDRFIRTTDPDHVAAVQAFLQAVKDNGHLYKADYAGWYCVACEAYYEPDDLLPNPDGGPGLDPVHERPVEWFEEENWFFRLSAFEQPLLEWYESAPEAVVPAGKRNEALGLIRQGLKDISITRTSLDWGVPVPWDEGHVFYVWYDALINYATAIGYGSDPERFAHWWPHVHHLLAKDILRFHCVYWPAMLLAAGEAPPAHLNVHGYLLVGGAKMSKTKLNQIFPADLVADVGVDGFRHHFLRHAPFGPDGDVSYEGIVAGYNADLANNLGNLLSRVATVVAKKCDGVGPAPRADSPLAPVAAQVYAEAAEAWEAITPSVALDATWHLIREANALLEAAEPWKADPGPAVDGVLGDALEVLRLVAMLASPSLTRASEEIWRRIGLEGSPADQRLPDAATWGGYPGGLAVEKGAPLFPRLKVG
ncbi:MAG: methionine--tRNA ligase [Acidimicrobiales bacterium]|nr:methionine--tRNA ligase [Acidimicrobiales bacterium]